jgi:hypothetical protein
MSDWLVHARHPKRERDHGGDRDQCVCEVAAQRREDSNRSSAARLTVHRFDLFHTFRCEIGETHSDFWSCDVDRPPRKPADGHLGF